LENADLVSVAEFVSFVRSFLLPTEVATFSLLLRVFSSLLARYSGTGTDIFRLVQELYFFLFFCFILWNFGRGFEERFVAAS
jgi:hypothetical protein